MLGASDVTLTVIREKDKKYTDSNHKVPITYKAQNSVSIIFIILVGTE